MNTITVLPYGSKVQLAYVDLYGFCGRDLHPDEADVGFLGVVVGNVVAVNDENGCLVDTRENVLGGSEYTCDEDSIGAYICYKVRAADGRELELMNHEIEEI